MTAEDLREMEAKLEEMTASRPRTPLARLVVAGPSPEALAWDEAHPEVAELSRRLAEEYDRLDREAQAKVWAARNWERAAAKLPDDKRMLEALRSPKDTPAALAAKAWDWRKEPFLFLFGGRGAGKSTGAALAAQRMLTGATKRLSLCWVRCDMDCHETPWGPDFTATRARWRTASLLVVDDAMAESEDHRRWSEGLASELVARAEALAPTILTSNLGPDDLERVYGSRLRDRLRGITSAHKLGGESLRKKASA